MPKRRRTGTNTGVGANTRAEANANSAEVPTNVPKRTRSDTNSMPPPPPIPAFNRKKCLSWFNSYIHEPIDFAMESAIGPDGMEQFCKDLGVAPEDIVMLILAWKMNARRMGFFAQSEWIKGMTDLNCDGIEKLRAKIKTMKESISDVVVFKDIYRYAFEFARDADQRSMDIETALVMLKLLLADKWEGLPQFNEFLKRKAANGGYSYKALTKDQWNNILEFSSTIKLDMSNYDINGAWPVMLDEFVEWSQEKNGIPSKND